MDERPAYLTHSFSLHATAKSIPHTVVLTESITTPNGKGDIMVDLERGFPDNLIKIETGLSYRFDEYDDGKPDGLLTQFADDPVTEIAAALIPIAVQSEAVRAAFTWARFVNETTVTTKMLNQPLVKLAKRLFDEQNILDFHRVVLDTAYRDKLLIGGRPLDVVP